MRDIDNDYIKKRIIDYLKEFNNAVKNDLENVLINKLSKGLDIFF
jgi:hypothetical protein